jgi:hypothetical protein
MRGRPIGLPNSVILGGGGANLGHGSSSVGRSCLADIQNKSAADCGPPTSGLYWQDMVRSAPSAFKRHNAGTGTATGAGGMTDSAFRLHIVGGTEVDPQPEPVAKPKKPRKKRPSLKNQIIHFKSRPAPKNWGTTTAG